MDDNRTNNLDYEEFKSGIVKFGLNFDEKVILEMCHILSTFYRTLLLN